ncbi:MAG: hypothetical protein AB1409_11415 [Pseudomonadota bacterium]
MIDGTFRHDSSVTALSHPDDTLLDQWRAGLLRAEMAARVDEHVRHCPRCRRRADLADAVLRRLDALPHPRLRPARAQRPLPGMAPVYRLGAAMATLLLVIGLSWQMHTGMNNGINHELDTAKLLEDPQTVDMLSDLEFYQWLAEHPDLIKNNSHDA